MSSREIAELTQKEHRHVRRDISKMFNDLEMSETGYAQIWTDPQNGQNYEEFLLPKDLTLTLISGYNVRLRKKIIDRWIELEGAGQRSAFTVPRNLSEALRLAADQAEQIEVMKPVVAAYNRLAKAQGSVCLTDAAKMCQMKPQAFIRYLNAEHWIYRRVGSPAWIGYAEHLDNGDLEHKYTTVQRDDGTEKITTQARVTAQGVTKLCLKLGIPAPAFDKQEAAHATV
ncbi:phage antirepressor KilAC domain-containing protein [Sorlinia euscelidii]